MAVVQVKERDHIIIININRVEVRNALSTEVILELDRIFMKLANDRNTRVVLIHGAGDKAFSAGADLKERIGMGEQETLKFVEKIQSTFQKLASLPMPTIAAINGDAFGGGLELALACDIRVMSSLAEVGLTECSLGIIPGAGGTQRLPKIIGVALAKELIFSSRRIKAAEALAMSLISHMGSDSDETKKLALKVALAIAKNAPLAVRAAKESIDQSEEKNMKSGLSAELAGYHSILDSADRKEGLKAFLEKRPAVFSGT